MIELKSPAEIERMRVTGQFVAQTLSELGELADVGVNLLDLEHHVRDRIRQRGARSCYWDYAPPLGNGPFRNVICLSVNDAVLHGLLHDYPLDHPLGRRLTRRPLRAHGRDHRRRSPGAHSTPATPPGLGAGTSPVMTPEPSPR